MKLIINDQIDLYNDGEIMLTGSDGLGVNVSVNTAEFGAADGGLMSSCRVPVRHITLQVLIKCGGMAAKKRLYKAFGIKKKVTLRYVNDLYDVCIDGYCESINIPPNGKPLTGVIGIVCESPYFYATESGYVNIFGTNPMFHFTESGIELNEVIYSDTTTFNTVNVEYDGDVSCGAVYTVKLHDNCSTFRIDNFTTGEYMRLDGEFLAGDVISISTLTGEKFITLERDGVIYNRLRYMTEDSVLFGLSAGDNLLRFTGEGLSVSGAGVSMRYNTLIGGV